MNQLKSVRRKCYEILCKIRRGGRKCIFLFLRFGVITECLFNHEKRSIIKYLLKPQKMAFFPYSFVRKYKHKDIKVFYDKDKYPYVLHGEKQMFMKKSWTVERIKAYYTSILCEQDEESPHRYLLNKERYPEYDSIVADIGAAEGVFSLDIIDYVKKIYLFECDPEWLIPLKKTFANWEDKVEIVEKYVGDRDDKDMITLDRFFNEKNIHYIKADIEGAEERMLIGGKRTFLTKVRKTLICTYHLPSAESVIYNYLEQYGFRSEYNPGYVLFIYDLKNFRTPFARHALIYGYKK